MTPGHDANEGKGSERGRGRGRGRRGPPAPPRASSKTVQESTEPKETDVTGADTEDTAGARNKPPRFDICWLVRVVKLCLHWCGFDDVRADPAARPAPTARRISMKKSSKHR